MAIEWNNFWNKYCNIFGFSLYYSDYLAKKQPPQCAPDSNHHLLHNDLKFVACFIMMPCISVILMAVCLVMICTSPSFFGREYETTAAAMTSRFYKTYSRKGGSGDGSKFDEVFSNKKTMSKTKWGETTYRATKVTIINKSSTGH